MSATTRRMATMPSSRLSWTPEAWRPGGYPLAPLLPLFAIATVGVGLTLSSLGRWVVALILGLAFASFILMLHSPSWALLPILLTELTLSNHMVRQAGMSLRLMTVLIGVGLASLIILRQGNFLEPRLRRVVLPSLAFILIVTFFNIEFSTGDYVQKYFRYQLSQFLPLILMAYLIRDRRDLRRVLYFALIIGLAGAVIALWQHFDRWSAPIGAKDVQKGRSVGFSTTPIYLANQLPFVLMFLLGILTAGPWRRDWPRVLQILAAMLLIAGTYVSYTRSALLAIGVGVVVLGVLAGGHRRLLILGTIVAALLAFQLGAAGDRYYKDSSNDNSAASHEALLYVSLAVAQDNFWTGVGHEHVEDVSVNYVTALANRDISGAGYAAIGQDKPHNDWLSVWMSWGIFALIAYAGIFLGTVINCLVAMRNPDPLIRGLAMGCIAGLAAYSVNSFLHNYLDSSVALWLYAGFSVALARMTARDRATALASWSAARASWSAARAPQHSDPA